MDFVMMREGWTSEETAVVQTVADAMGWVSLAWALGFVLLALVLIVFATQVVRRRAFWCAGVDREVEVEFVDRGVPGFRRRSVLSCSAFEHPGEITCR